MKKFLNHEKNEREINKQLQNLETLSADDSECAGFVARIHSLEFGRIGLPFLDAKWVMGLVRENLGCDFRGEIISALETMDKIEHYGMGGETKPARNRFMAWDIENSRWQGKCKSGKSGSYALDIAAIIEHANDAAFSDAFLEGYISCGGKKPTLAELYSNLYYVKVARAAMADDLGSVMQTTRELMAQNIFKTELIAYSTLNRLSIVGY